MARTCLRVNTLAKPWHRRWLAICKADDSLTGQYRARRVKCDETRPACRRCVSIGRECGYLQSRDAPAGATSVASSRRDSRPVFVPIAPKSTAQLGSSVQVRDLLLLIPLAARLTPNATASRAVDFETQYHLSRVRNLASYLFELPRMAGHSPTLDNTIECVVAALRNQFMPPNGLDERKALLLYTRSLRDLQLAVRDPKLCLAGETLCATQLLCIYESLNSDSTKLVAKHTRGASQLIQHRGPHRFTTEFERSLLLRQLPFISAEAAYKATPCFLEHPDWIAVLKSAVSRNPLTSDQSEAIISFNIANFTLARLLGECAACVLHQDTVRVDWVAHASLLRDVKTYRGNIIRWYLKWGERLHHETRNEAQIEPGQFVLGLDDTANRRRRLINMHHGIVLFSNRIHVALGGDDSYAVEHRSQSLAASMASPPRQQATGTWESNNTAPVGVAAAVLATSDEWAIADRSPNFKGKRKLISAAAFRRFAQLSGLHLEEKEAQETVSKAKGMTPVPRRMTSLVHSRDGGV